MCRHFSPEEGDRCRVDWYFLGMWFKREWLLPHEDGGYCIFIESYFTLPGVDLLWANRHN